MEEEDEEAAAAPSVGLAAREEAEEAVEVGRG